MSETVKNTIEYMKEYAMSVLSIINFSFIYCELFYNF